MAEKNMNAKISVEFEETVNRQQLSSGDNLSTLFGKIKKFFTDLKPVALSGSYNDLSDRPTSLPANGGNADTVKTQKKANLGTSYTAYYPAFVDSDNASATDETLYTHYNIKFFGMDGTADTEGYAGLQLGNTTTKGNAGNSKGQITFYNNENAYYAILRSSTSQGANATIYLPAAGGTLALNTVATTSANGLMSTGTQTFAGAKTFNGVVKVAGATAAETSQVRNIAAGTAAATTTNCPNGALYGQYS